MARPQPTPRDPEHVLAWGFVDGRFAASDVIMRQIWDDEVPQTIRKGTLVTLDDTGITYGPGGYRCGCGKDAHSNLTSCDGPDQPATTLVYSVTHPREGFPGETWQASYGTRTDLTVDDVPALAIEAARNTRVGHSYTGPLTVSVWEARDDEHYRLPVPETAAVYGFPEGQPKARVSPDAGDPTACDCHGAWHAMQDHCVTWPCPGCDRICPPEPGVTGA